MLEGREKARYKPYDLSTRPLTIRSAADEAQRQRDDGDSKLHDGLSTKRKGSRGQGLLLFLRLYVLRVERREAGEQGERFGCGGVGGCNEVAGCTACGSL